MRKIDRFWPGWCQLLPIIKDFACYHTDASRTYPCVIEGKLLLGSAGTSLGGPCNISRSVRVCKDAKWQVWENVRHRFTIWSMPSAIQSRFIARMLCFYYFAEGSNFLKARVDTSAQFSDVSSPPPDLKMEFEESRCLITSPGNFTSRSFCSTGGC